LSDISNEVCFQSLQTIAKNKHINKIT
jgi:SAM-dependent MidA family methyltransferase